VNDSATEGSQQAKRLWGTHREALVNKQKL